MRCAAGLIWFRVHSRSESCSAPNTLVHRIGLTMRHAGLMFPQHPMTSHGGSVITADMQPASRIWAGQSRAFSRIRCASLVLRPCTSARSCVLAILDILPHSNMALEDVVMLSLVVLLSVLSDTAFANLNLTARPLSIPPSEYW